MVIQNFFKKIHPLIVWGIADIFFILAITVTIVFGVLSPDLQAQLNLSNSQLGFLGFAFFLSFGITPLLAGGLIDSLGPRITLAVSACVSAVGLYLLSTAEHFQHAFIAQIISGAGLSTSYIGAIYLATMWFSQKYFSLIAGITLMSGNIVSATLISILALGDAVSINYRVMMNALALVSLIIAILLFLLVRKSPNSSQPAKADTQKTDFWKDLSKLLHIPQFWLGSIYFSATMGVFLTFSSLWNIPESLAYGHSLKTATMLSATLRYGTALGSFLCGFIASYLNKCAIITKFYSFGALLMGIILFYGPDFPLPVVFLVFALIGFFFGGAALGFPLVGQYIPATLKGTGFGLMASMGYLLCAFLQYLTGVLLNSQVKRGFHPTTDAFIVALTPLVITLTIGWICTFWLKDVKNNPNPN